MSLKIAVALVLFLPSIAAAAPCGEKEPRIAIDIEGASPELARSVREELTAELKRHDRSPASESDATKPLVRFRIELHDKRPATIHIEDGVTKKKVDRDVEVEDFPPDGLPLALAIAADELLDASWAECAAAPPPPPPVKTPPPVVPPPPPKPVERPNEIGLRAAVTGYGGGQTHIGGALYFRRDFIKWLSGEIFAYGREGLAVDAPDGTINAHAFGAGLALDFNVIHVGPARFGIEAGTEVGYVVFEGHATNDATESSFASVTSFGLLGIVAAVDVAPIRMSAAVLALAPFKTASAMDGSDSVTRVSGPGIAGTLGAGVLF